MINNIKEYVQDGLKNGFSMPAAKDGSSGEPSATLWFAYMTFFLALAAVIYFIVKGDPLASSTVAVGFWALSVVFYRIRKLDKFKVDFDDKSIELDGGDDEPKKT